MKNSKPLEKPMSFKEVQEFLGRGHAWLYDQLQRGKLPGHKLGGKWIIYPSELQNSNSAIIPIVKLAWWMASA